MRNTTTSTQHLLGGPLNTLAQSGSNNYQLNAPKLPIVVYGKGLKIGDNKALKKRARGKLKNDRLMPILVTEAEKNGDYNMIQGYWNTYHCQRRLVSGEGRLYAPYCKNRACLICQSNRKAEMINKYLPILKQWKKPHFVTLTIRAVPAASLSRRIQLMMDTFQKITKKYRDKHRNGKSIKLMGVRSLECNFNPIAKTYNPHFHLIVKDAQTAMILRREWQEILGRKYVEIDNQKMRPIKNNIRDLIETFKYSAKIFTDPDMKKKKERTKPPVIYAAALHHIFKVIKPRRVYDRFGFNLPKQAKVKPAQKTLPNYAELFYDSVQTDWVSENTGEPISGYVPLGRLHFLLANNIDTTIS